MKRISITPENKWIFLACIIPVFQISYLILNYLPIDRHSMQLTSFEQAVPFLPWTIILYLSAFLQAVVISFHIPKKEFVHVLKYIFGIYIISFLFFIIVPVEYPRYLFSENASFYYQIMWLIDNTGNCFPSLHVSLIAFLTFSYLELNQKKDKILDWFFIIWAALIIISVLTTKQHYLYDVYGGLVLAIIFYYMLRRKLLNI